MSLRRAACLAFLLLAAAAPYPPPPPSQSKAAPNAYARAAAGWRSFAARDEVAAATEELKLGEPKRFRIRHALQGSVTSGKSTRWFFCNGWPPEGDGQRLRAQPKGRTEIARDGQRMAVGEVRGDAKNPLAASWDHRFEVEMRPRQLRPASGGGKGPVEGLAEAQARPWLASTDACGWAEPEFQAWLDRTKLRPEAGETECGFARRAVRAVMAGRVWRDDPASSPVRLSKAQEAGPLCCWESALRAVGALRAAGIPARVCVGYFTVPPAGYTDPRQVNAHARLEFFARGIGWVPADATPPVKAPPNAAAFEAMLARRVGFDDGTFVVLHHDLGPVWKRGEPATVFRMLPGVYVEGDGVEGAVKFTRQWQAEKQTEPAVPFTPGSPSPGR